MPIPKSFQKVGIEKTTENIVALTDAQNLTNEKGLEFRIQYEEDELEGFVQSVDGGGELFELCVIEQGDPWLEKNIKQLEIRNLKKIELINPWGDLLDQLSTFRIYVDDERALSRSEHACNVKAKSVKETILLIEEIEKRGKTVELLDMDHDLGVYNWLGGDAIKVLDYLVMEEKLYPIVLHTQNGVGAANMERMIERYWA